MFLNIPNCFNIWPNLSKIPPYHKLGDRVVFVNNHSSHINFGELGTVIGIYNRKVEILFDRPFFGATNLNGRCPNFRGS